LFKKIGDVEQAGEVESAACSAKFPELAGQLLLILNPGPVGGGCEGSDAFLAQGRRGVSAQQMAERFKLQDPRAVVNEALGHDVFMLQESG
jgi:hypothetical protein